MEADPNASGSGDVDDRIAALKHRHRNRLQSMVSLTGLFGRRLPAGACHDAFAELRARFETLGFVSPDDALPVGARLALNLPELADRLSPLLDPERRRRLTVSGGMVTAPEKTAEAAAQILAEMMIELFRRGLPKDGAGEVRIETLGDDLLIFVAAEAGEQSAADGASDLSWSLATTHARSCGGVLTRASDGPFQAEARIPICGPSEHALGGGAR